MSGWFQICKGMEKNATCMINKCSLLDITGTRQNKNDMTV